MAILAAGFLIAATALWLAASSSYAAANSVSIEPSNGAVVPGGNATVNLSAEPSAASLAVWLIRVQFDPAIVSVPKDGQGNDLCTPLASPAGSASASACEATDTNADGKEDTVVALGAVVFHDSQRGLESKAVLAAITFHGEGSIGQCSPLTIEVGSFIDPAGLATNPTVTSGQICVQSGVQRTWGDVDCNNLVKPADAMRIFQKDGGLALTAPPNCPNLGDPVSVGGLQRIWGDVDCNNLVKPADAMRVFQKDGGLTLTPPPDCPNLGDTVTVQ